MEKAAARSGRQLGSRRHPTEARSGGRTRDAQATFAAGRAASRSAGTYCMIAVVRLGVSRLAWNSGFGGGRPAPRPAAGAQLLAPLLDRLGAVVVVLSRSTENHSAKPALGRGPFPAAASFDSGSCPAGSAGARARRPRSVRPGRGSGAPRGALNRARVDDALDHRLNSFRTANVVLDHESRLPGLVTGGTERRRG